MRSSISVGPTADEAIRIGRAAAGRTQEKTGSVTTPSLTFRMLFGAGRTPATAGGIGRAVPMLTGETRSAL